MMCHNMSRTMHHKLMLSCTLLFACLSPQVSASQMTPQQTQFALEICQLTASNNSLELQQLMKSARYNPKLLARHVYCDGQPLLEFAKQQQASKIVRLLQPAAARVAAPY